MATHPISAHDLTDRIRAVLRTRADPEKAGPMQAYMKSAMPFRGIPAPVRRKACNSVFRAFRLDSSESWQEAALDLWRNARYREERYEAIDLTGFRYYDSFQTPGALGLYEEMVVTGAWWDYVDEIAVRRVGVLLERFPAEIRPRMLKWAASQDIWKRRTSIICQIKFKGETDLDLLFACIEPSIEEKEFFLRKAIGWSLRETAKVNPGAVKEYVAASEDRLSGLSKREALKHVI